MHACAWQHAGIPASGGRLFIADGLFDLSYGPCDVVLIDGNIPHGITSLSPLPGLGSKRGRAPLERFSMIFFSKFKRRKGMLKHGNYTATNGAVWSEEWHTDVLWTDRGRRAQGRGAEDGAGERGARVQRGGRRRGPSVDL